METPDDHLETALLELAAAPEPTADEVAALIAAVEADLQGEWPRRSWWIRGLTAAALLLIGLIWQPRPAPNPVPLAAVDALLEPMPAFASFANSAVPVPQPKTPPPNLLAYHAAADLDDLLWQHSRDLLPPTPQSFN
jgi:hypothetical protein